MLLIFSLHRKLLHFAVISFFYFYVIIVYNNAARNFLKSVCKIIFIFNLARIFKKFHTGTLKDK